MTHTLATKLDIIKIVEERQTITIWKKSKSK